MTLRDTPSCCAGVGTVVAVTTTGSTFCETGGFVSSGFVSCATAMPPTPRTATTTAPITYRTIAPFRSKGALPTSRSGLLTRGSPPPPGLPGMCPSGFRDGYGRGSPHTVAGPCRPLTGFPWHATLAARTLASPPVGPEHTNRGAARGRVLVDNDAAAVHRFQQGFLQHLLGRAQLHRGAAGQEKEPVRHLGREVQIV